VFPLPANRGIPGAYPRTIPGTVRAALPKHLGSAVGPGLHGVSLASADTTVAGAIRLCPYRATPAPDSGVEAGQAGRTSAAVALTAVPATVPYPHARPAGPVLCPETHTHPHIVVQRSPTTILPPTPRPGGRLPRGLCRLGGRHVEAHNDRNTDSNIELNNDADVFSDNVLSNFACNAWYNAACNHSRSARRGSRFSYRQTCRRTSLPSERYLGRYFLANNARHFAKLNRALGARPQSARMPCPSLVEPSNATCHRQSTPSSGGKRGQSH
jgi:hypothetical protein